MSNTGGPARIMLLDDQLSSFWHAVFDNCNCSCVSAIATVFAQSISGPATQTATVNIVETLRPRFVVRARRCI
jgi:hypothetical protein